MLSHRDHAPHQPPFRPNHVSRIFDHIFDMVRQSVTFDYALALAEEATSLLCIASKPIAAVDHHFARTSFCEQLLISDCPTLAFASDLAPDTVTSIALEPTDLLLSVSLRAGMRRGLVVLGRTCDRPPFCDQDI